MKKILLFFLFSFAVLSFAAEAAPKSCADTVSYFQLGFWYNFPKSQMTSDVYGIKTGWPMCAGEGSLNGIEASWLGSLTHKVNGFQASWTICYSRQLNGLQATLITCLNTETLNGAQLAPVFNMACDVNGLQASCINISNNFIGFQPAAIMNVSQNVTGFQAAPVLNVAADVTGMQAGLINTAKKSSFQLGLVNVASNGCQIGLLNFMKGGFLPFFPIINFGCAD